MANSIASQVSNQAALSNQVAAYQLQALAQKVEAMSLKINLLEKRNTDLEEKVLGNSEFRVNATKREPRRKLRRVARTYDSIGSIAKSWLPLEGDSPAAILAREADPFHALSIGAVPAIIIRGALHSAEAKAVSSRLLQTASNNPDPAFVGLFTANKTAKASKKHKSRGPPGFGAFGAMISRYIGKGPAFLAERAREYRNLFEQHELMSPVAALHHNMRALSAGRSVGLGRDLASNRSLSVGGAYRMHYNNMTWGLHFDSLHSKELLANKTACRSRDTKISSAYRGRQAQAFTDLYRFEHQFAALITLQRSDRAAPEMSVVNVHRDEIAHACNIPLVGTLHNTYLSAVDLALATTENVKDSKRWGLSQMRRWRSQLGIDERSRPLDLQPGDMYIFDANRLHVVHPTVGSSKRISLGAFVGFSEDEMRIWS